VPTKKILICPLNWGLGHATRCVPVINSFLKEGAEVVLASDGVALEFLKKEFPLLTAFQLPAYNVQYPQNGSMTIAMLLQSPKIFSAIKKEHKAIEKIIQKNNIDIVVSDNRYGCYSKKLKSVFITHQLFIQTPVTLSFLKPLINYINNHYIKKYNIVWVPDIASENNLSGKLSHQSNTFSKATFIGTLSRFSSDSKPQVQNHKYKLMVLLSGPEPQRTLLEKELLAPCKKINEPILFVRGKLNEEQSLDSNELNHITFKSFLSGNELKQSILDSEIIVCRSGYSTIMDLAALNKKAILIPTTGQTEQVYLAQYFFERKIFNTMSQDKIDLSVALHEQNNFKGIFLKNDFEVLLKEILQLLK
jgi:uncharacterized protein (TIGR00661 family)